MTSDVKAALGAPVEAFYPELVKSQAMTLTDIAERGDVAPGMRSDARRDGDESRAAQR